MRSEIAQLVGMGALPEKGAAPVERLREIERLYYAISKPVTDDEARALVRILGNDDCYGLAPSFVLLIESAPGWPLIDCLSDTSNRWVKSLHDRAELGGAL